MQWYLDQVKKQSRERSAGVKENGRQVLAVATAHGLLVVENLQLEGKKVMSAEEFLRGYPQIVGDLLG